jgi:hypothetical protein
MTSKTFKLQQGRSEAFVETGTYDDFPVYFATVNGATTFVFDGETLKCIAGDDCGTGEWYDYGPQEVGDLISWRSGSYRMAEEALAGFIDQNGPAFTKRDISKAKKQKKAKEKELAMMIDTIQARNRDFQQAWASNRDDFEFYDKGSDLEVRISYHGTLLDYEGYGREDSVRRHFEQGYMVSWRHRTNRQMPEVRDRDGYAHGFDSFSEAQRFIGGLIQQEKAFMADYYGKGRR